jgi:hypothetical protein
MLAGAEFRSLGFKRARMLGGRAGFSFTSSISFTSCTSFTSFASLAFTGVYS